MREAIKAGVMNDNPYDPAWHWTKTKRKIKDIIRSGEEFMLEYKENGNLKVSLGSDLIGSNVWVGDERILITEGGN